MKQLQELVKHFESTVSQWHSIEAAPHRFGGTEFKIGKVEIGHIHRYNGMVDIPFTVKIREQLIKEELADFHHLLRDSGWITYFIHDESSLEQALWLMRLSYLHKRSRRHVINAEALHAMNLSQALKVIAFPGIA